VAVERLFDGGVYSSVSGIGDAASTAKGYVSRILRLALLAPDIIETNLVGKADQSLIWRDWSGHCRRAGRSTGDSHLHGA
jgi:hypothetical protein